MSDYAAVLRAPDWAGTYACPTELERSHGVAPPILQAWQKQYAKIGVQVGRRKHAFPVKQFVDGRPVPGLRPLLDAAGDTRTARR